MYSELCHFAFVFIGTGKVSLSRITVFFFSVWWQRSSHGSRAAPQLGVAESVWDARDGWWAFIVGNHVQSSQFEPQQYQALTDNIRKTQGKWSLVTVWLKLMLLATRTVLMAKTKAQLSKKSKKKKRERKKLQRLWAVWRDDFVFLPKTGGFNRMGVTGLCDSLILCCRVLKFCNNSLCNLFWLTNSFFCLPLINNWLVLLHIWNLLFCDWWYSEAPSPLSVFLCLPGF